VAILVLLFSVQRFGTDKVGYSFAPIISVWFAFIAAIGMYNLVVHDATVLRAFNPMYIVHYFRRNGKDAWVSLGGAVLCITGMAPATVKSSAARLMARSVDHIDINCNNNICTIVCNRHGGHVCRPRPFQHQGHSGS
jgi:hypothetical protein